MSDPRVQPLIEAARKAAPNYDPHFANVSEREIAEATLFLARIDTLREIENIPILYTSGPDGVRRRTERSVPRELEPIPMILFCHSCGVQHIDAPEPHKPECPLSEGGILSDKPCTCGRWTNPPHRSHLCAYCGHVWRPADVPTTGVKDIATQGSRDSSDVVRGVIDKTARFRPQWRHKRRQTTYVELGRGELQVSYGNWPFKEGDRMVAYKGDDNRVWFRLEAEFIDGRFEKL